MAHEGPVRNAVQVASFNQEVPIPAHLVLEMNRHRIESFPSTFEEDQANEATSPGLPADHVKSDLPGRDHPDSPPDLNGEENNEEIESKAWTKRRPYFYLEPAKGGDPWVTLHYGVTKYDDETCKAWNGELDTILTFTGLFSAAVTAFCVESLQSLSQNPADTTNSLLLIISTQLANSSAPAAEQLAGDPFRACPYNVETNVLYFVSLTLALSVSAICILGKQWIREYQRDISMSPCDAVRVRQARFDALHAYKVPEIMASLPVILLTALILFFVGLLNQLWHIDNKVTAGVVSVVVGATIFLVLVTTALPAHSSGRLLHHKFTPFRSPQSWIYFVFYRQLHWIYDILHRRISMHIGGCSSPRSDVANISSTLRSWVDLDAQYLKEEIFTEDSSQAPVTSVHRALQWILRVLGNASDMEITALWCLQKRYHPRNVVQSATELGAYVLSKDAHEDTMVWPDSKDLNQLYYGHHCEMGGTLNDLNSLRGRIQAELVIRIANQTIDNVNVDDPGSVKNVWDVVSDACGKLIISHKVFRTYVRPEIKQEQDKMFEQTALMLKRLFRSMEEVKLPPVLAPSWFYIMYSLFNSSRHSYIYQPIERSIVPIFRHNRSIPLLCALGQATIGHAACAGEYGLQFFTTLDAIMVDMIRNPEGVNQGMEEEDTLLHWPRLRLCMINLVNSRSTTQLTERHFDDLHGSLVHHV